MQALTRRKAGSGTLRRFVGVLIVTATVSAAGSCRAPVEPTSASSAAMSYEGGFLAVESPDALQLAEAVRRIPGVWGVQVHPPAGLILHAPSPLPAELRDLLHGAGGDLHVWRDARGMRRETAAQRRLQAALARLQEPTVDSGDAVAHATTAPPTGDAFLPPPASRGTGGKSGAVRPGGVSPLSYAAGNYSYHMSEMLLGSVAVVVILPESTGGVDAETETWTQAEVDLVLAQLSEGLSRLQAACKACDISFVLHVAHESAGGVQGVVDIDYEAIARPFNDADANLALLEALGVATADQFDGFRLLNNAARDLYGTDWAVSVKIARDVNDADGFWQGQSLFAASYLGGPYLALTYRNGGDTFSLWKSFLHELNHLFGALDEYHAAGLNAYPHTPTAVAGYYAVANAGSEFNDGKGFSAGAGEANASCIMMRYGSVEYCAHTQGQLGWWDTDADGVMDAYEGAPSTTLALQCDGRLSGSGLAVVDENALYPKFPDYYRWKYAHRVGLGTVESVEYRINAGPWMTATPADGAFDSGGESFTFDAPVRDGAYVVEARAARFGGQVDTPITRATCTVTGSPFEDSLPFPAFEVEPAEGSSETTFLFDAWESFDFEDSRYALEHRWDWQSDGVWDTDWLSQPTAAVRFSVPGLYAVTLAVRDRANNSATVRRPMRVRAVGDQAPRILLRADRQVLGAETAPSFRLSVTGSTSPDEEALAVRWDFEADGVWDTPFLSNLVTDATYAIPAAGSGQWQVAAEVSAATGARAVDYLLLRAVAYNRPPVAAFTTAQVSERRWTFDASPSSDPDRETTWDGWLEYRWDFEGDGRFDTPYTTSTEVEHEYAVNGRFQPTLEVRDRFRFVSRADKVIDLRQVPPGGLQSMSTQAGWGLSWQAVGNAVAYAVEVARDPAFGDLVYRERVAGGQTEVTLPFAPDDAWYARVAAYDQGWIQTDWSETLSVEPGSRSVGPYTLDVTPDQPTTIDALVALIDDAQRLPSGYTIRWYRDGAEVAELSGRLQVDPAFTRKHERFTFGVTAFPGGVEQRAPEVTILNSPPSIAGVTLRLENGDLYCAPQGWVDVDGDAAQYRISWEKDGRALAPESARLERPQPGAYRCTVVPDDGEADGAAVTSAAVAVAPTSSVDRASGGCASSPASDGWRLLLVAGFLSGAQRMRRRYRNQRA